MRTLFLRLLGAVLLITHSLLTFAPTFKSQWSEIYLYNSIILCAVVVVWRAPRINDLFAQPLIIMAMSFWLLGSLISSIATFVAIDAPVKTISNLLYLCFYPCIIMGVTHIIAPRRKFALLEIFDSSIFGLGLSTLGTTLILRPLLPHFGHNTTEAFFALVYPICDLILISVTLTTITSQGFSRRGVIFTLGIVIFSLNDFVFLWQQIQGTYSFGSLIDDGWLFGLLIMAESCWHENLDSPNTSTINPIFIALSVLLSATLLALIALRPGYFPIFTLIPAIITLALAFIRMTIALNEARSIGHERILARTDELTGLPNRRRLISEIEGFELKDGSLLLLDLDGFKPVNDSYGHETGDKVLQQVALRFSRAVPHGTMLARLGGDEFGVLHEGSYESAMDLALALRATLSYPFNIEGEHIQIGVSIGVAKNNGESNLLRRADDAMYKAKREGLGVCRV